MHKIHTHTAPCLCDTIKIKPHQSNCFLQPAMVYLFWPVALCLHFLPCHCLSHWHPGHSVCPRTPELDVPLSRKFFPQFHSHPTCRFHPGLCSNINPRMRFFTLSMPYLKTLHFCLALSSCCTLFLLASTYLQTLFAAPLLEHKVKIHLEAQGRPWEALTQLQLHKDYISHALYTHINISIIVEY